jgi:hypothetical protein
MNVARGQVETRLPGIGTRPYWFASPQKMFELAVPATIVAINATSRAGADAEERLPSPNSTS